MNDKFIKYIHLIFFFTLVACKAFNGEKWEVTTTITKPDLNTTLSSVQVVNNQITINGSGFTNISAVKIQGNGINAELNIDTKTDSKLIVTAKSALSLLLNNSFNLIIGNAEAQVTYPITFSLQNGAVESAHLAQMGAASGQVLKWNGAAWLPSNLAASQLYLGNWNASTATPDLTTLGSFQNGDYYVVNVGGTYTSSVLVSSPTTFAVGDWIMFNGSLWEKIDNSSSAVSSFQGRHGAITLIPADYVSLKNSTTHKITGSALNDIADIDLSTAPTSGQVLKWNSSTSRWEAGDDLSSGGPGSVTTIELAAGSVTYPKLNLTDGDIPQLKINGLVAALAGKEPALVASTTAKYYRGDKTWQTLGSDIVTEGSTNLYFTSARSAAKADVLNGSQSITASNVNTTTINGLPFPDLNATYLTQADAASTYQTQAAATTALGLKLNNSGGTLSGVLTLDNDLKIKGGSNYVTLRGHAASGAYNLILPSSAGTSGYVLQTDGSGNLSWINPSTVSTGTGTVTSASITDGAIVDVDINSSAAIAQSKIANLTTDLANKISTTLTNGNILIGNGSNVATSVALSGDATISNAGALTLASSGVSIGTYKSVTVDVKGRVTGGTNPTTLSGYGITDTLVTGITATAPITNTGTATVPVIGIPAATTTVDGYLSSSDWNTFSNKQNAISGSSSLNTGSLSTNDQGGLVLNPYGTSAGQTGELHLRELASNGSNYVALKSPDSLAANVIYTLPLADGSSGQVLTTNASGVLSWSTVATGSTTLVGDIGGTIGANTIGAGKVNLAHLSATGTKNSTTYLRGDNTWSVLQTDAQALVLSAYTLGTNAVVSSSDSIVGAFGKLQKQITDLTSSATGGDLTGNLPNPTIAKIQGVTVTTSSPVTKNVLKYNGSAWVNSMIAATDISATGTTDATTYLAGDNTWKNFNTSILSTPLTGLSTATATSVLATDTVLEGMGKAQGQINNKLNSSSFVDWSVAGVATLEPSRLNLTTASRAVATNASGVPVATSVTATELGYLSGVTSAIQTQLGTKQATIDKTTVQPVSSVKIYGANSTNYVELTVPTLSASTSYKFPTADGFSGQALVTDSLGNLSWATPSGSSSLSGLSSATAVKTLANSNYAQVWNWDTLTTETAMTMASNSLTTGGVLALTDSNNNVASTGTVLNLLVSGTSSAALPLMITNAGTGLSYRVNDDGTTTDTSPFVIDATGNVGVGIAIPTSKLHISQNTVGTNVGLTLENLDSSNGSGANLRLINNSASGANSLPLLSLGRNSSRAWGIGMDTGDSNKLKIGNQANTGSIAGFGSGTVYLTMDVSGNLGLGNTTPFDTFDVTGRGYFNFGSGTLASAAPVVNHSAGTGYTGGVNASKSAGDTTGAFHAALYNVKAANPDSYALIGIGRADSSWASSLSFAALTNGAWLPGVAFGGYTAAAANAAQIGAAINGVVDGTVSTSVLPTAISFRTSTTNNAGLTERMRITSTGFVGIGMAAPTKALQVAGEIAPAASNTYSLGDSALLYTVVYATNGTIQTSDARKKKDITNSDLGLSFINSLRPVSYHWKSGPDNDLHYGLIAQETEKAIVDAKEKAGISIAENEQIIISHDKKTDSYGLKYTELISPVIKAIQELSNNLKSMFVRLLDLENKDTEKGRAIAFVNEKINILEDENLKLKQENLLIKNRLTQIEKLLQHSAHK